MWLVKGSELKLHLVYVIIFLIFKIMSQYNPLHKPTVLRKGDHLLDICPHPPLPPPQVQADPHQHRHYRCVETEHKLTI